jgi:hypothetical protein
MIVKRFKKDYKTLLEKIEFLSKEYYQDIKDYDKPFTEFFNFIKDIPYKPDPPGDELVMRPLRLFERNAGDCDDKTVAFMSYFIYHNLTTGFSLVSQSDKRNYHHIFCFVVVDGQKLDIDATYSKNRPFEKREWKKRFDKIIYRKK